MKYRTEDRHDRRYRRRISLDTVEKVAATIIGVAVSVMLVFLLALAFVAIFRATFNPASACVENVTYRIALDTGHSVNDARVLARIECGGGISK